MLMEGKKGKYARKEWERKRRDGERVWERTWRGDKRWMKEERKRVEGGWMNKIEKVNGSAQVRGKYRREKDEWMKIIVTRGMEE